MYVACTTKGIAKCRWTFQSRRSYYCCMPFNKNMYIEKKTNRHHSGRNVLRSSFHILLYLPMSTNFQPHFLTSEINKWPNETHPFLEPNYRFLWVSTLLETYALIYVNNSTTANITSFKKVTFCWVSN